MALGHPEERCDRIGADRQANVIEPEGLGGRELVLQVALKLQAQCDRGIAESSGLHRASVS